VALQGVDAHPLLRRTCPADQDEEALGRGLLGTRLESLDYVDSRGVQSPFVERYGCCAIVS
jgi:hypothetical protein